MKCMHTFNVATLSVLTLACVFFSFYDVVVVGIYWSLGVYVPCFLLFGYGLFSWIAIAKNASCPDERRLRRRLKFFGVAMAVLTAGLAVYGIYLLAAGGDGWYWGLVTLVFGVFTTALAWSGFGEGKVAREDRSLSDAS